MRTQIALHCWDKNCHYRPFKHYVRENSIFHYFIDLVTKRNNLSNSEAKLICQFPLYVRDQSIEPILTSYILTGCRGGKAYMKLKRYEQGLFEYFSKRGSAQYEADRRGGQAIFWMRKCYPVPHLLGFNCLVPERRLTLHTPILKQAHHLIFKPI